MKKIKKALQITVWFFIASLFGAAVIILPNLLAYLELGKAAFYFGYIVGAFISMFTVFYIGLCLTDVIEKGIWP